MTTSASPATSTASVAVADPAHFYCEDDMGCTQPMCGAAVSSAENGKDCPLCGLVLDEIYAGERPCPYCKDSH